MSPEWLRENLALLGVSASNQAVIDAAAVNGASSSLLLFTRTSTQLAAAPTALDQALAAVPGATFRLDSNPRRRYVLNSDGSAFLPVDGVVGARGAPASVTGTTSLTLLCPPVPIPVGMMGPNSALHMEAAWSETANTNSRTMNIKIGPTEGSASLIWQRTRNSATSLSEVPLLILQNRGSLNAQDLYTSAGSNYGSNLTAAPVAYAVDFSITNYIYYEGQLTNTADLLTLENYFNWVKG